MQYNFTLTIIRNSVTVIVQFNNFHECRDNMRSQMDSENTEVFMLDDEGIILYHENNNPK